jgi:hypothetical protein
MPLEPGFREISADELIRFLIHASGQDSAAAVNPKPILDLLRLQHLSLDFTRELPEVLVAGAESPRALLSFPERVIATAHDLDGNRARFSTFHEIGHYVLPRHVEELVLCTDTDMSGQAQYLREQEANSFAAAMLFHGDRFRVDANSHPISAKTVKELAETYQASYEATARRLVETNLRPCMLIGYAKAKSDRNIDLGFVPRWRIQYTVASPEFAIRYFNDVSGDTEDPLVGRVVQEKTDVADSLSAELTLEIPGQRQWRFRAEYFHNTYKVFCLLTPLV